MDEHLVVDKHVFKLSNTYIFIGIYAVLSGLNEHKTASSQPSRPD